MTKNQHTFEENMELLEQSLNGAAASLTMAKKVLKEMRSNGGSNNKSKSEKKKQKEVKSTGVKGVFDGQFMVTEEGQKYQVPENYASKSLLVYGDKLKMIEEDGEELFKQLDQVERYKTEGVLVKKDGRWAAITEYGSHKVLPASVAYYDVKEGDGLVVVLPEDNKNAPFAAIQETKKLKNGETEEQKNRKTKKLKEKKTKPKEVKEEKPLVRKGETVVEEGELR